MLSFFRWVLFFMALFVTLMGGELFFGHQILVSQGPLEQAKHVVIPRGAGPVTMAKLLREEGVLSYPLLFRVALIIELVRKTEALSGEITLDLKEGDLLPETYFYSRDDTRDGLLSRMKEAMEKTLEQAWRKRAAGLPLANRREALVLA